MGFTPQKKGAKHYNCFVLKGDTYVEGLCNMYVCIIYLFKKSYIQNMLFVNKILTFLSRKAKKNYN